MVICIKLLYGHLISFQNSIIEWQSSINVHVDLSMLWLNMNVRIVLHRFVLVLTVFLLLRKENNCYVVLKLISPATCNNEHPHIYLSILFVKCTPIISMVNYQLISHLHLVSILARILESGIT